MPLPGVPGYPYVLPYPGSPVRLPIGVPSPFGLIDVQQQQQQQQQPQQLQPAHVQQQHNQQLLQFAALYEHQQRAFQQHQQQQLQQLQQQLHHQQQQQQQQQQGNVPSSGHPHQRDIAPSSAVYDMIAAAGPAGPPSMAPAPYSAPTLQFHSPQTSANESPVVSAPSMDPAHWGSLLAPQMQQTSTQQPMAQGHAQQQRSYASVVSAAAKPPLAQGVPWSGAPLSMFPSELQPVVPPNVQQLQQQAGSMHPPVSHPGQLAQWLQSMQQQQQQHQDRQQQLEQQQQQQQQWQAMALSLQQQSEASADANRPMDTSGQQPQLQQSQQQQQQQQLYQQQQQQQQYQQQLQYQQQQQQQQQHRQQR